MIYSVLLIFGLALGSFVNALVWRLHEQEGQMNIDDSVNKSNYDRQLSIAKGRSMCTHCHHQLAPIDLIPVISWVSLRGRCRYCQKAIGWQYPVVELFTASLFCFSYLVWPSGFHELGIFEFIIWLISMTGLVALAVYDLKWFLLPNKIIFPLIGLALIQSMVVIAVAHDMLGAAATIGGAVLVGGGIFYTLFQVSRGQWIGGGDVKLGFLLGLLVASPLASGLMIFVASLLGTILALPLLGFHRLQRSSHIPFGPFLIVATIIVRLLGGGIIRLLQAHYILP